MRQALELALEALENLFGIPDKWTGEGGGDVAVWRLGGSYRTQQAITAIKEALAQPEQEPVAWKLMPKKPTEEMLKAMDECSTEGYDERLYAGHAASVYMAAWDEAPTPPQPERYITDAMKVRQAVAQALLDDVYAEELEQPEAKQSGTISITTPAPIAYLCENATGHKYFRWKKPSNVYKPIPLYTAPPQRTWVGLTDEEVRDLWSWSATSEAEKTANTQQHAFARAIEVKLKEKDT